MENGQGFNSQIGECALWKNESLYNIWKNNADSFEKLPQSYATNSH